MLGEEALMERVTLHDLLTDEQATALHVYVTTKRQQLSFKLSARSLIMKWLDGRPDVMQRFRIKSVLKTQGAAMIESWLML